MEVLLEFMPFIANKYRSILPRTSSRACLQDTLAGAPTARRSMAIPLIKSSYRDLIAVSKLFIKLDPVVKPRDDAEDGLSRRAAALLAMTPFCYSNECGIY